jgi:3-dehydroquinate dehydratase type I
VTIKICVPIIAKKPSDIPALIKRAWVLGADLGEVRLDYLEDEFDEGEVQLAIKNAEIPLIATNRQLEHGGKGLQDEDMRVKKVVALAGKGFSMVDIETIVPNLKSVVKRLKRKGVEVIVSYHDFNKTPSLKELQKVASSQIRAGADICKIVTKANNINDNITCLSLTAEMSMKTRIVCFAMGTLGILSRILSPIFGSYFTYASLESGMETAAGQINIQKLKEIYRCLGVMGN